ncbi:MAG: hypothetical protein JXB30_07645 [Anaerolineae bacterium]|nr:hypothetical protein [Anaerolineae bacterium]
MENRFTNVGIALLLEGEYDTICLLCTTRLSCQYGSPSGLSCVGGQKLSSEVIDAISVSKHNTKWLDEVIA